MSGDSREEYLEAIYNFNVEGEIAKTSKIAEKLGISPPSVTQMIQKMAEEDLVKYEPYRGVVLTGKGMALAQKVVRKHRLLERFLRDFLGLRREKVHEEACKLEHGLSDWTALALCDALTKKITPRNEHDLECTIKNVEQEGCSAINQEKKRFRLLTELSNLKPGEEGVVAFIRGGRVACQRLLDMGLTRGTRVQVMNAAPFRGPMKVKVRGSLLAIGRGLASHVFVEIENEDDLRERRHPHGPYHRSDL